MAINIFEPSLQVRHPLLDYEKLQIQGTFPRPHEIPTDVFPTYSVIAGVHVDRPVGKVATFTEDNRMRVDASASGSDTSQAIDGQGTQLFTTVYQRDETTICPLRNSLPKYLYSVSFGFTIPEGFTSPDSMSQILVYLRDEDTNEFITVASGWLRINAPDPTWNQIVYFNPPLNLIDTFGNADDVVNLVALTNSYDLLSLASARCSKEL